ncbi:hypothetical protein [Kitasatospora kazusensis]
MSNARTLVSAARRSFELQIAVITALQGTVIGSQDPEAHQLAEFRGKLQRELHVRDSEDHFRSCALNGGHTAFIDRQDLRRTLQQFVDSTDKIVLIVDGEQDTGRSYTYELIRYLGQFKGFRPVVVPLGVATTAENVLQLLSRLLRADLNGIPGRHSDSFLLAGAVDVFNRAVACSERPWLVFDDCDKLDQNSDVWDFIGNLAEVIYQNVSPYYVIPRLVLLGYQGDGRSMPYPLRHSVLHDKAREAERADVRAFFNQHFTVAVPRRESGEPYAEADIPGLVDVTVEEVMRAVRRKAGNGESYMRRLCTAVEAVIHVDQ